MLDDKVIIITGAATGIGHTSALHFAECGARIVIADCDVRGADTAAQIRSNGGQAAFIRTDVAIEGDVEAMVACAIETYGRLDGAFNNAGIETHYRMLEDLTADQWQRVIDVDLTGVFLCMKHEIRAMRGKGGAIVNMSSALGEIAQAASGEYVSAKHGVIGLTRAGAVECAQTGVRVNAILPGMILTPMVEDRLMTNPDLADMIDVMRSRHSVGRTGEPRDVAYAAKWLLGDESAFVNGLMMNLDGGYTVQ